MVVKMKIKNKYMADFETTTWEENKTSVWAWAICEIGNTNNIKIGTNIESFLNYCESLENSRIYFHNLRI